MTLKVYYSETFLKDAKKLGNKQQVKLSRLVVLLQENPFHPKLHTKPLSGELSGLYSFRITRDWRAYEKKSNGGNEVTSRARAQVQKARNIQFKRFSGKSSARPIFTNAEMSSKECEELISLSPDSEIFLKKILEDNLVSARGYYRILKTARTITDLEESPDVKKEHLSEAFSYRIRNRE